MSNYNFCFGAMQSSDKHMEVLRQMHLAHRYRNKLVEIELERRRLHDDAVKTLHPEYARAKNELVMAEELVDQAYDELRKLRSKARRRVDPPAELQELIKSRKAVVVQLSKALEPLKREAYNKLKDVETKLREEIDASLPADMPKPERNSELFTRLGQALVAAGLVDYVTIANRKLKAARAKSELYWGTYLIVEDAAAQQSSGPPPKFKQAGTPLPLYENGKIVATTTVERGTIGVQISGGMSVVEAVSGQSSFFRMNLPPLSERMARKGKDHGKSARGTFQIRIGSDERRRPIFATFPFSYGRALPPDGKIKYVYVDCWRVGQRLKWRLRLLLESNELDQKAPDNDKAIAIHLGYRSIENRLRVAVWRDSDNNTGEIYLEESLIAGFEYPRALESIRDKERDKILPMFIQWIDAANSEEGAALGGLPDWFKSAVESIGRWKGQGRLRGLIGHWYLNRFEADRMPSRRFVPNNMVDEAAAQYVSNPALINRKDKPDVETIFGYMYHWLIWDSHILDWSANQSANCRETRIAMYRKIAKEFRKKYKKLFVYKVDWKSLGMLPDETDDVTFTNNHRRAAKIAAPYSLEQMLSEKFRDDMHHVAAVKITRPCAKCDHVDEWDTSRRVHQCTNCGHTFDQDHNAVINTLELGMSGQLKEKKQSKKAVKANRKKSASGDTSKVEEA